MQRLQSLVAAYVNGPVHFEPPLPSASTRPDVLVMYSRAADKIEAGTGVELGRRIDLRG